MTATPAVFVSHGAPTQVVEPGPARDFFASLSETVGRPRAILCATAHWTTKEPCLGAAARPETVHDFFGFPEALYRLRYPAPGDPDLAGRAATLLREAGIPAELDPARGLDHGTWTPLLMAWPEADIPVVQLSVQQHRDAAHHLAVGRALAPLREDGVLVLGSGGLTHNLRDFGRFRRNDRPPAYVEDFEAWVDAALLEGRTEDLLRYRTDAPEAARNHPSPEHFLPLFVALGAGGEAPPRRLHASHSWGILSMAAYAFA